MRRIFKDLLKEAMLKDDNIYVFTADLGYKLFDSIRDEFPDRFFNLGSSEQAMIGIAAAIAANGKIPICYSITPFLIKRPYEFIDIYLNHEKMPVKLVGGGLFDDYGNLGYTHHSNKHEYIFNGFENIKQFYPEQGELNFEYLHNFLYNNNASFLGLRR